MTTSLHSTITLYFVSAHSSFSIFSITILFHFHHFLTRLSQHTNLSSHPPLYILAAMNFLFIFQHFEPRINTVIVRFATSWYKYSDMTGRLVELEIRPASLVFSLFSSFSGKSIVLSHISQHFSNRINEQKNANHHAIMVA